MSLNHTTRQLYRSPMRNSSLALPLLLITFLLLRVQSQGERDLLANKSDSFLLLEILLLDDSEVDFNVTNDPALPLVQQPLPVWTNQQVIVCLLSVSLGTLLFLITFIVPAMIIVRRTRREKHRLDLRELRRMSDFM